MNKNEIYIKSGTNYKEMTKELLTQCGLASVISDKKMQIGIKPNLVSPSKASWGATTHPEIVAGIIEYLQENGYGNIAILEGSWVGDKTEESFEVCGYNELAEKYLNVFCSSGTTKKEYIIKWLPIVAAAQSCKEQGERLELLLKIASDEIIGLPIKEKE